MKYLGCLIISNYSKSTPLKALQFCNREGFKFYSKSNTDEENEIVKNLSPCNECFCSHKNLSNNFYIKNDNGDVEIWGSQCIKKFLSSHVELKKEWEMDFNCKRCNKKAIPSPINGNFTLQFRGVEMDKMDKMDKRLKKVHAFNSTGCCLRCISKLLEKRWAVSNNSTFLNQKLIDIISNDFKRNKLLNLIRYVNESKFGLNDKWIQLKEDLIILEKVRSIESLFA